MVQCIVSNKEYSYEWFMQKSKELNRTQCTLPEDTINTLKNIKIRLNIRENHVGIPFNKPIIIQKKEDKHNIFKLLNKITNKSYDKLSKELLEIVDYIVENETETTKEICQQIFNIITNNSLCSSIYAKLYFEMIQKHDIFRELFDERRIYYLDHFKNIKFVSPNENYDDFCLYVKEMEKMKNFSLFLVQCVYYSICKVDDIMFILLHFQEQLNDTLTKEECINENEHMVDAMYLILKDIIELAMFHEQWETVEDNMGKLNIYQGLGKNNKIKFKIMDIMDCIEKQK